MAQCVVANFECFERASNRAISDEVVQFRLGALLPQHGVKSKTTLYNLLYSALRPVYPLLPKLMAATSSEQLGNAMIHAVLSPQPQKILENNDINRLATDVSWKHSA
jgi:hypothetical protein